MKLEKGDAFGELALLYDSVRSATIVTDGPTELITLDKDSFRKHIRVRIDNEGRKLSNIVIDNFHNTSQSDYGIL